MDEKAIMEENAFEKKQELQYQVLDPRINFITSALVTTMPDAFVLSMACGNVITSQNAFTPEHFKKTVELLNKTLADYEEKKGVIETKEVANG